MATGIRTAAASILPGASNKLGRYIGRNGEGEHTFVSGGHASAHVHGLALVIVEQEFHLFDVGRRVRIASVPIGEGDSKDRFFTNLDLGRTIQCGFAYGTYAKFRPAVSKVGEFGVVLDRGGETVQIDSVQIVRTSANPEVSLVCVPCLEDRHSGQRHHQP